MTLLNPWWLIPAVILAVAFFIFHSNKADDWHRVIKDSVFHFLTKNQLTRDTRLPALLIASIACIALTGPSIKSDDSESYRHAQGWLIVADVSRSMTLDDTAPTRLAAMRNVALELSERAGANSTTLVIYAGDAFIAAPPSFDNSALQNTLALLEHGIVPMEGSNLTRALSLTWSVIEDTGLINARLFVLSDTGGFNNKSDAAIARLATQGHRTDVIIFGSEDSDRAAPFDLPSAKALANSGRGELVRADGIGQIDFSALNLQSNLSDEHLLTRTGLSTIQWRNQSHWLLLLTLPLMLWLFHREFRR